MDCIDNLGVKPFVLVAIEFLVLGFTFRCTVQVEIKFTNISLAAC